MWDREVQAPQKHKMIPSKHPQNDKQHLHGRVGMDAATVITDNPDIIQLLTLLFQLTLNLGAPKILFSVTWDMLENKRCWSTVE